MLTQIYVAIGRHKAKISWEFLLVFFRNREYHARMNDAPSKKKSAIVTKSQQAAFRARWRDTQRRNRAKVKKKAHKNKHHEDEKRTRKLQEENMKNLRTAFCTLGNDSIVKLKLYWEAWYIEDRILHHKILGKLDYILHPKGQQHTSLVPAAGFYVGCTLKEKVNRIWMLVFKVNLYYMHSDVLI